MSTWPGTASRIYSWTRFPTTRTPQRPAPESKPRVALLVPESISRRSGTTRSTRVPPHGQTTDSRRISTKKSSFPDSPFGPSTIVHSDYAHYHHSRSTPQRFRPSVMFETAAIGKRRQTSRIDFPIRGSNNDAQIASTSCSRVGGSGQ